MAISPETLARHELNGLSVTITAADDPTVVGIDGRVVGETERTLRIEADDGIDTAAESVKQIPKAGATFEFALAGESVAPTDIAPADPDAGETVRVAVDGERLVANPARRTEKRGDSKWR